MRGKSKSGRARSAKVIRRGFDKNKAMDQVLERKGVKASYEPKIIELVLEAPLIHSLITHTIVPSQPLEGGKGDRAIGVAQVATNEVNERTITTVVPTEVHVEGTAAIVVPAGNAGEANGEVEGTIACMDVNSVPGESELDQLDGGKGDGATVGRAND
ncbi:hypothetical protein Scep_014425 [Stephania cephalantha]|uniref:Uncharacterized protein n=1 Tax=Stephania cephalantha TaxID=152367 RepID=A0AAP0J186_9MAGN